MIFEAMASEWFALVFRLLDAYVWQVACVNSLLYSLALRDATASYKNIQLYERYRC